MLIFHLEKFSVTENDLDARVLVQIQRFNWLCLLLGSDKQRQPCIIPAQLQNKGWFVSSQMGFECVFTFKVKTSYWKQPVPESDSGSMILRLLYS